MEWEGKQDASDSCCLLGIQRVGFLVEIWDLCWAPGSQMRRSNKISKRTLSAPTTQAAFTNPDLQPHSSPQLLAAAPTEGTRFSIEDDVGILDIGWPEERRPAVQGFVAVLTWRAY